MDQTIKQPNSLHCFVCGLENVYGLKLKFYTTPSGEVTVDTIIPEHYQSYPGIVHGGIVAAIMDEVAGRTLMGDDAENTRFTYTARLTLHYRKNVPIGQPLRFIGQVQRNKARVALATCVLYGPDDELLADAEVLLVNVPDDVLASADLQALGWKVYPD